MVASTVNRFNAFIERLLLKITPYPSPQLVLVRPPDGSAYENDILK